MREPHAQLLDISARRGRRCVPSAVAAGQVALSRRRGAISCFHFYFLKPPSNHPTLPRIAPTAPKKEAASPLNILVKCTLSSCESSLSSPLPSSLRSHWLTPGGCLCSTNLARVTLFPLPVPTMLIIILEVFFRAPLFLQTLKTFQISLRPPRPPE